VGYVLIIIEWSFIGLGITWSHTAHVDTYIPYVTSGMAYFSAFLLAVFVSNPTHVLYRLAGTMLLTTLAARVVQVTMNMINGGVYQSHWTGVSTIVTTLFLILLLGRTWDRDVRTWVKHQGRDEQ
jgi:hypothetical protein